MNNDETIEKKVVRLIQSLFDRNIEVIAPYEIPDEIGEPPFLAVIAEIVELAIAEEREAGGWHDIATAPKDGEFIDLWARGERLTDCFWNDGKWKRLDESAPKSLKFITIKYKPDYWMNIPAAPKDEVSN